VWVWAWPVKLALVVALGTVYGKQPKTILLALIECKYNFALLSSLVSRRRRSADDEDDEDVDVDVDEDEDKDEVQVAAVEELEVEDQHEVEVKDEKDVVGVAL